jgi:hypothetical protein
MALSPEKNLALDKGIANISLIHIAKFENITRSQHYLRHRCTMYKQKKCNRGNKVITDIYK